MSKLICAKCMKVHLHVKGDICPECNESSSTYQYKNSDEFLQNEVPRVIQERREAGLDGLVGGLQAVIINTESEFHVDAVKDLLRYTGLNIHESFQDRDFVTSILSTSGSADFLVRSRRTRDNPFRDFNRFPKSHHLPNTRLETFVFETKDIEKYVDIQKSRGVRFQTDEIVHADNHSVIQTIPSSYTGNSIGLIQWNGKRNSYATTDAQPVDWHLEKPDNTALNNIWELDHTASRVRAKDRDAAIIEFMELTNYHFDFAIYINSFNSITNVARLSDRDFAMVFTSGISPFTDKQGSGPTEKFIHNYGTRVHHLAFRTMKIEETFESLKSDGMNFLLGLVGSREEGLKQTFSTASPNTLLVNEYIHRYGDFDGFFTKSNVNELTAATNKQ